MNRQDNKKKNEPSANEQRAIEYLKGQVLTDNFTVKDDASEVALMLYFARPEPDTALYNQLVGASTNLNNMVGLAANLKEVGMTKRIKHAIGNMLSAYDIANAIGSKLGVDTGDDSNARWYYEDQQRFVTAAEQRAIKDANSHAKLQRVGAQEVTHLKGSIRSELCDVLPGLLDNIYTALKSSKTTFSLAGPEVKMAYFAPGFLKAFKDFMVNKTSEVGHRYEELYSRFVEEQWLTVKDATNRTKMKLPPLAEKLMSSTIAAFIRSTPDFLHSKGIGEEGVQYARGYLRDIGLELPHGAKLSDINPEAAMNAMITSLRASPENFLKSTFYAAVSLGVNSDIVRGEFFKFRESGRENEPLTRPFMSYNDVLTALGQFDTDDIGNNRMVNAGFAVISTDSKSQRANPRKPIDPSLERVFLNLRPDKVKHYNNKEGATPVAAKDAAIIISDEAYRGLSPDLQSAYAAYHNPNPSQCGYTQKYTMSLLSAAKQVDESGKTAVANASELPQVNAFILLSDLYCTMKAGDVERISKEAASRQKSSGGRPKETYTSSYPVQPASPARNQRGAPRGGSQVQPPPVQHSPPVYQPPPAQNSPPVQQGSGSPNRFTGELAGQGSPPRTTRFARRGKGNN